MQRVRARQPLLDRPIADQGLDGFGESLVRRATRVEPWYWSSVGPVCGVQRRRFRAYTRVQQARRKALIIGQMPATRFGSLARLAELELLHAVRERRRLDAEQLGGAVRAGDAPLRHLEREQRVLALELAHLRLRQQWLSPSSSLRARRAAGAFKMSLIARSSRRTLPRDKITARSMTFLSSRMLPGQS